MGFDYELHEVLIIQYIYGKEVGIEEIWKNVVILFEMARKKS